MIKTIRVVLIKIDYVFVAQKACQGSVVQPSVLMPAIYADDSFSAKCANDEFFQPSVQIMLFFGQVCS